MPKIAQAKSDATTHAIAAPVEPAREPGVALDLDDAERAFFAFLSEVRPAIEARLAARWDAKLAALRPHGAEVSAMAEAARDLTLRGGKRYRAALLAAAYAGAAPEAPREPALDAGVALELFQSYLLIQDDWMDGDALRRGGPSAHAALATALGSARLGDASAILASDLTWGFALEVLAGIDAPAPRVVDVVRRFCRVHEDVVVGQQMDLLAHADDVEAMHALKTGSYTVRGPLVLGAVLAGAGAEVVAGLEAFAAPVGVAFQLRDDLLGTFATTEETGKPEGGDLRAGKRTAVIVEAEARLSPAQRAAVDKVFGRADASRERVRDAIAAVEACGARRAVAERLAELASEAARRAEALPFSRDARRILVGAAAALRMPIDARSAS